MVKKIVRNIKAKKFTIETITKLITSKYLGDEIRPAVRQLLKDNAELRRMLEIHHQWQNNCQKVVIIDENGADEIIDCEYYDSGMCEDTAKALNETTK